MNPPETVNLISITFIWMQFRVLLSQKSYTYIKETINFHSTFFSLITIHVLIASLRSHISQERRIIFITDANAVRETRKILSRRRIESNGNFRHQISAFPSRIRVPLDRQRVVARAIHRHDYWWQGSTHETHAKVAKNDVYRYKHFTEYHLKFFLRPHRDPVCIQPFSFLLLISEWSIFLSEFVTLLRNFHRFFEIFFSLLLLFS